MHKIIHLAPSILAADFARLGEQVQEAEANGAELIHIDVMDGQFVPNISMGKMVVEAVRRVTHLPLDVHLMIVQPAQHIEAFAHAGADRITVHYEADHHLHRPLPMQVQIESLCIMRQTITSIAPLWRLKHSAVWLVWQLIHIRLHSH